MRITNYATHEYDMTDELAEMWREVEEDALCEALASSPWEQGMQYCQPITPMAGQWIFS